MLKLCLFVLNFSLIFFYGFGSDSLLSKFHQADYKIKDFRCELSSANKNITNFVKIVTYKYNRSVAATNITFNAKIDINGKKLEIIVQAYKMTSNQYRTFPIRFQVNTWKAINANVLGIRSFMTHGNFPSTFFFKKNTTYITYNFVPDEKCFPPNIPTGLYMIECTLVYENTNFAIANVYLEIYCPIVVRD